MSCLILCSRRNMQTVQPQMSRCKNKFMIWRSCGMRLCKVEACFAGFVSLTVLCPISPNPVIHPSNNSSSRKLIRTVALQTSPQVVAQCGKNVTLTCDATSSSKFSVVKFAWLTAESKLCQLRDGKVESDVLCESKTETLKHSLMLTLTNITPADQGNYTCKVHSDIGAEHNTSVVTVQGELTYKTYKKKCFFSSIIQCGQNLPVRQDNSLKKHFIRCMEWAFPCVNCLFSIVKGRSLPIKKKKIL